MRPPAALVPRADGAEHAAIKPPRPDPIVPREAERAPASDPAHGVNPRAHPGPVHSLAVAGLAPILLGAAPPALAHAGERGFIMLLPTGLFQAGGTIAVAVSFLVVISIHAAALRRIIEPTRWALFPVPRNLWGSNAAASAVLVGLIVAGLAGSRDPLANPLPLSVWTLLWVGLTFAHAAFGYLWPLVNPWTAVAGLARRVLGLRSGGDAGVLAWPEALDAWPAVVLLLVFAWFELVHPAPRDPAVLAWAVAGYSVLTVTGMVLFGDRTWTRHVEIFSRFFRIVSWLAPFRTQEEHGVQRLVVTWPGARLLGVETLSAAGVVFVVVALATVSFDGLSRTFWWLDLVGENPLEHPGRTALVARNTLGLAGAAAALLSAYAITAAAGARWSGARPAPALRRFVVSIVPIAFGYHFAHYLPSFLVDAQYALKALSDPFDRGWNLLGASDLHVTASFLTHHASVELIWYAQTAAIVVAHVAAVVILHGLAGESGSRRTAAIVSELPLTVLMIGYTLFGLWLLSTPVAASVASAGARTATCAGMDGSEMVLETQDMTTLRHMEGDGGASTQARSRSSRSRWRWPRW